MKTKTITVYTIDELTDKAKEQAYHEWLKGYEYFWADENRKTLEAFAALFPIKIQNWSYGDRNTGVTFTMPIHNGLDNLKGLRLSKYLWNKYGDDLFKPKYLGWINMGNKKSRPAYSKCQRVADCVLTGYCMDEEILKPVYNFLKTPKDITFHELMSECLQAWADECAKDAEEDSSFERFIDEARQNEWTFDEGGRSI